MRVRAERLALFVLSLVLATAAMPTAAQTYVDDFDRADNAALGAGWIEKQPNAFALSGGAAIKQAVSTGYHDNLAYRPAAEDLRDVEASVELRLTSTAVGYPQVHVRVQSATVATLGTLDAYMLYMDGTLDRAILARQRGTAFATALTTIFLDTPLNTTDRFRLRLRAVGTNPVQLEAWIERWNGAAWAIIGQGAANDTATDRITTAGSVGFSGYVESSYRYDVFTRTNLGAPGDNPVPVLTTVAPNSVVAGSGAFTLNVEGSSFVSGATVRWNGADRPTTFVSATSLQAAIGAADVATPGSAVITVFNPAPGGGLSNSAGLVITDPSTNPVPTVTTLAPNTATAGGSAFSLAVQGSNFVPGAIVRWNGADRITTYVSATQLQAAINAADIAAAGQANVTVFNPAPGGGVSNNATFTITDPAGNPVPTISALNPSSAFAGGSPFLLTVQGTSFVAGATVTWNGNNRTTTFVSATTVQATITAADIATAGTAQVRVSNPTPGGGASNALTFSIQATGGGGNAQTLTQISPLSANVGGSSLTLTVTGSGFTTSSVVRMNGTALTTTFNSATQLSATVSSSLLTTAARPAVVVSTPTAQNPISDPLTFFVLAAGEQLFFDNFNRPNNAAVGNGWTEKMDSAFRLENGSVPSIDTSPFGFTDAIMYRPAAEDALDVETSVEFTRTPGAGMLYPQVHARVDRGTVASQGLLSSYTLFYDDGWSTQPGITITPIDGWGECYLGRWLMTQPFVMGDRYRLRFVVRGSLPVVLTGYLDHLNVDRWEQIATGTVSHDQSTQPVPGLYCNVGAMPPPRSQSGGTGLAKWRDPTDRYDNYYSIRLAAAPNPVPVNSSLTPSSAAAGSAGFNLTVQGSSFLPNSVVRWNGSDRATTFISPTELRASISSSLIATAGTATVTVFNPAPGGGLSAGRTFTINAAANPAPTLLSLSPGAAYVNTGPMTLTVGGSGFVAGSTVRWSGSNRSTTLVSGNSLTATITAADLSSAGTFPVTVFTPAPGGGTSNSLNFTVNNLPTGSFFDSFDRADNANLGQAWIEKALLAFSIAGNQAVKEGVSTGYRDNIVYRPAAENLLDVEASIELMFNGASIGYPQVFTRVQTTSSVTENTLDAYILYVENSSTRAILGRNRGTAFVTPLATIFLDTPLNATDRFRLRLRTTGTTTVQVNGYVERFTASGWQIIGQASASDTSAQRLSTSGSVGFGGYTEADYRYDNFNRLPL